MGDMKLHLAGDFKEELYNHFKAIEGSVPYVYADIYGVPTLGIGYALVIKDNNSNPPWGIRKNLKTQLLQIGITLSQQDESKLGEIATALNAGDQDKAKQLINGYTFSSIGIISESEIATLLDVAIREDYAPILRAKLGSALYDSLTNSKELIALLSITYNRPADIDAPLVNALQNSNRAEAWFEIRYGSNVSNKSWLATRRYSESDLFGLLDSGAFTDEGTKEVFRMYTKHRSEIDKYENDFSPPSFAYFSISAPVLQAKEYLVNKFGQGKTIDNIIIGAGLQSYENLETWTIDKIFGTDGNDMIFGEKGSDILEGGNGEDVIYGGEGNDMITGGQGNDYLEGGAGNDVYYINTGDGTDTIEDKEGNNRVIVNGKEVGLLIKQDDGTYKNPDGKIKATIEGTDLVLYDTVTGAKVAVLNENFQDGDFGIRLLDTPSDPTITNTISGDLTPHDFDPDAGGIQSRNDEWGNIITDPWSPSPNRKDTLYDTTGNDRIEGGGGEDYIEAKRGGDEWLSGGDGSDVINSWNTSGIDIIEGGTGSDVIYAGAGDDQVFGENSGEMETLIADGEVAPNIGTKGDLATGNDGNDLVYGSNAKDALFSIQGKNDLILRRAA